MQNRMVVLGASPVALAEAARRAITGVEVRYLGWQPEGSGLVLEPWDPNVAPPHAGFGDVERCPVERSHVWSWPIRRWARSLPHVLATRWPGRQFSGESYADWLQWAFGPASSLWLDYAERRFGTRDLPWPLAWAVHAQPPQARFRPLRGGQLVSWQSDQIYGAGGEVLREVQISRLDVEDDRVVAVETEFGLEYVDDGVAVDAPPEVLARWCPELLEKAEIPIALDAFELSFRTAMDGPAQVEIVEEGAPVWRLKFDAGRVTALATLTPDTTEQEAVRRISRWLAESVPVEGPGVVRRLAGAIPGGTQESWRRWRQAAASLGIELLLGARAECAGERVGPAHFRPTN